MGPGRVGCPGPADRRSADRPDFVPDADPGSALPRAVPPSSRDPVQAASLLIGDRVRDRDRVGGPGPAPLYRPGSERAGDVPRGTPGGLSFDRRRTPGVRILLKQLYPARHLRAGRCPTWNKGPGSVPIADDVRGQDPVEVAALAQERPDPAMFHVERSSHRPEPGLVGPRLAACGPAA
jgi:hypothetical protein